MSTPHPDQAPEPGGVEVGCCKPHQTDKHPSNTPGCTCDKANTGGPVWVVPWVEFHGFQIWCGPSVSTMMRVVQPLNKPLKLISGVPMQQMRHRHVHVYCTER